MAPVRPREAGSDKYGFKNRKSPMKSPVTPQKHKPNMQPKTRNTTGDASPSKVRRAKKSQTTNTKQNTPLRRLCDEGTARCPIVLPEDFEFNIKLEDDPPVKVEAEVEPGNAVHTPIKVENDGSRQSRGYAVMTPIQKLIYSLKQKGAANQSPSKHTVGKLLDGGIRKRVCKPVGKAVRSPANKLTSKANRSSFWFPPRESVSEKEDGNELDMDEAGDPDSIVGDDSRSDRALGKSPHHTEPERQSSIVSPPASPSPLEKQLTASKELSQTDLAIFRKAFQDIWFGLGYETFDSVIRSVNGWLTWRRLPFSHDEAILALKSLEEEAHIRMQNGKVYWSWAYFMMDTEVKVEKADDTTRFESGPASPTPRKLVLKETVAVTCQQNDAIVLQEDVTITPGDCFTSAPQERSTITLPKDSGVVAQNDLANASQMRAALSTQESPAVAPTKRPATVNQIEPPSTPEPSSAIAQMRLFIAKQGRSAAASNERLMAASQRRSGVAPQQDLGVAPREHPTIKNPAVASGRVLRVTSRRISASTPQDSHTIAPPRHIDVAQQEPPTVASGKRLTLKRAASALQGLPTFKPQNQPTTAFCNHSPVERYLFVQPSSRYKSPAPILHARFMVFRRALAGVLGGPLFFDDYADFEAVFAAINERVSESFTGEEADQALERLSQSNKIMYTSGMIYKI